MEKNVTGMDELLAGYAAGTLTYPAQALVGAHLEMSGVNREYVSSLEALAGVGIEDADPVALTDRDAALEAILSGAVGVDDDNPVSAPQAGDEQSDVPAPLRGIIGSSMDKIGRAHV